MSTAVRLLTYDDLCQTPDDGQRYEIIGGELIVSPAPILGHQEISGELYSLLRQYVHQHQLGKVYFAPVDVRLGPHDIVEPDLLFIRQDRLDVLDSGRYVMGRPDLVVEIISPSSRKTDQGAKFDLYERAGIPEYWLVDPTTRRFQLFTLREDRYEEIAPVEERLHSIVLAGLVIDPGALFAGIA